jgi:hypothetical protein
VILGEKPQALFSEASNMSAKPVMDLFVSFVLRPPDQRIIGKFGFSEGMGPEGFDYIPLLPEYGGPTPI